MGYEFKSETDTEVLAHLINMYYKGDLIEAVIKSLKQVEGSYAIAVLRPVRFSGLREEGQPPCNGNRQWGHIRRF
jgi:glucosamine 6-phosphate synthetase-like amidotransferase/phosphosugar isomerase protein